MIEVLYLGRNVFKVTRQIEGKTYFIHVHAEDRDEAVEKADRVHLNHWVKVDV